MLSHIAYWDSFHKSVTIGVSFSLGYMNTAEDFIGFRIPNYTFKG